jgi:hypothetical protein
MSLSLSHFFCQTDQEGEKGPARIFSGVQEIFRTPFPLVVSGWIEGERGARGKPPSLLNPLLSSLADRPPTREHRHPPWIPRPHLAASRAEPASPSIGTLAPPAVDAQRGQSSTDRLSIHHLAIALTQLSTTNSTQRCPLGPTLRRAMAMSPGVTVPPRPPRATPRSRAHTHAPVPCFTPSCTATSTRLNATHALLPHHPDRPRRAQFLT